MAGGSGLYGGGGGGVNDDFTTATSGGGGGGGSSLVPSGGTLGIATGPAQIEITPNSTPPVAVDDAYSVIGGATLSVGAPGVLGNDSDAENDPLTAQLVSGPATGLTLNADGSFTYTPGEDTAGGTVTFTYRAFDGTATSNVATVTITVTAGCDGVRATRVGTAGKDTLTGTGGNDVIVGLGGNDTIDVGSGNDRVCGGSGNDYLELGSGYDRGFGGTGNDQSAADRTTTRCAATTATTCSTAAATATSSSATPASTGCSAAATTTPSTAAATPRTAATARAAPTPQRPANSSSTFPDAHAGLRARDHRARTHPDASNAS